jgi:single-strand DNA-binding protein
MTSHIDITDANIVTKPELRTTGSGMMVTDFRIAANKRVKNKDTGAWEKGEASFYTCVAFGQRAERILEEELQPGELVFLAGSQEIESFERKDGTKGQTVKIYLDAFGRDYKWIDKERKPKANASSYEDEPPF